MDMKLSIFIPDKTLKVIDDYCERNGYKRSNFLVMSALRIIGKEGVAVEKFSEKENQELPIIKEIPTIEVVRPKTEVARPAVESRPEEFPQFSDKQLPGYTFSPMLGKYVKGL